MAEKQQQKTERYKKITDEWEKRGYCCICGKKKIFKRTENGNYCKKHWEAHETLEIIGKKASEINYKK